MSNCPPAARRLLLVGWDAADWSLLHPLLDVGQLPALGRLVEGGASGRLLCSSPPIGAAQWVSLATGKRPWQHGVCHAQELADGGRTRRPVTAVSRRSSPLWEILARQGKKCIVVGWPASHGTANGTTTVVSDAYPVPTAGPGIRPWPAASPGTYWPANIGDKLDRLRVSPEDIQADVIRQYLPQWQKINQRLDHRLGQLRVLLAADYSCLAAFSELIGCQRWDFAAVRLPAFAQIARFFMPYHPPRCPSVGEQDFALYSEVMRSACRALDSVLERLIQLVGPQTAIVVVSGHGLRAFAPPPQGPPTDDAEIWKSPYGIFTASGSGFAPDALLQGATVLDVAPTLLTWFGLPIGDDMEGRVLVESFVTAPPISRVSSWDSLPTPEAAASGGLPSSDPGNTGGSPLPPLLQGAAPGAEVGTIAGTWLEERDWNLICSCLEAGQLELAMPVLQRLFQEFPERPEIGRTLFDCQLELRRVAEARQTLEVLLESLPPGAASLVLRAELAWAQRELNQSHVLVQEARRLHPTDAGILRQMGILLLRMRQWDELAELAREGLALDERDPIAWLGLATALLRTGHASEAADAAVRAIGLRYFLPDAHFVLVRALVAEGRWAQAQDAMEALLKIQPNNRAAAIYSQRIAHQSKPPGSSK